jgi:phosphatidylglycerol:prolipoprotein diacylglycerol transferase
LNNGNLSAAVAFNIFGLDIYWYAIIIVSGMLVAILLCQRLCKYRGLKSDIVLDMAIVCIPLGVIGARLYYIAFDTNVWTFAEIFSRTGGLAIYGGVIGGAVGAVIVCLYKKVSILKILDVMVPCLILAQAIGRWGNFANQEAYGNIVTSEGLKWFPYAVFIEAEGAFFQATFFYESLWNLIGAAILYYGLRRTKIDGVVAGGYLVFYGIGRVFIEGLRSDSLYIGDSGIRVSQLLSGILIALGAAAIICLYLRHKKLDAKQDKKKEAEAIRSDTASAAAESAPAKAAAIEIEAKTATVEPAATEAVTIEPAMPVQIAEVVKTDATASDAASSKPDAEQTERAIAPKEQTAQTATALPTPKKTATAPAAKPPAKQAQKPPANKMPKMVEAKTPAKATSAKAPTKTTAAGAAKATKPPADKMAKMVDVKASAAKKPATKTTSAKTPAKATAAKTAKPPAKSAASKNQDKK